MNTDKNVYIATVCLERTRWGKREPSYSVSEWLPRFQHDGFDGIELWSYHYSRAEHEEQERLHESAPIAIYNSYVAFTDEDAAEREQEAEAITRLGAKAVKFNVGRDPAFLSQYKKNLLRWADALPTACKLLCECHPGTPLETPDAAAAFHADLPSDRFGIIVHIGNTELDELTEWGDTFGDRVWHLHVQFRTPNRDPSDPTCRAQLDKLFAAVRESGFNGSATMEFTRGIGRDEDIETIYKNACSDMRYIRSQLQ